MEKEYLKNKVRASSIKSIDFIIEVDRETAILIAKTTKFGAIKLRSTENLSRPDQNKDLFANARTVMPVNILDKVSKKIFNLEGVKITSVSTHVYNSTSEEPTIKYKVSIKVCDFIQSLAKFIHDGNGENYDVFKCVMNRSSFLVHLLDLYALNEYDNSTKKIVYDHIRFMYDSTLSDDLKNVIQSQHATHKYLEVIDVDTLIKIVLNILINVFTASGMIVENIHIVDTIVSSSVYEKRGRNCGAEPFYEIIPAFDMLNIMETLEKNDFSSILTRETLKIKKNICRIDSKYRNKKHSATLENTHRKSSKYIYSTSDVQTSKLWAYNAFSYNISKDSIINSDLGDDVRISTLLESPDNYITYFSPQYELGRCGNVTINIYLNLLKNYKTGVRKSKNSLRTDYDLESSGVASHNIRNYFDALSESMNRYSYLIETINSDTRRENVSLNILVSDFIYHLFINKINMLMSDERIATLYTISYLSNILKFVDGNLENGEYREVKNYLKDLSAKYPDIDFSGKIYSIKDLVKLLKDVILVECGRSEYIEQAVIIIVNILTSRQSGVLALPGDSSTIKSIRRTILSIVFDIKCCELTPQQDKALMDAFNTQALHSIITSYAYGISLDSIRKYDICNPIRSSRVLSEILNLCIFLDTESENFNIHSK